MAAIEHGEVHHFNRRSLPYSFAGEGRPTDGCALEFLSAQKGQLGLYSVFAPRIPLTY